MEYEANMNDRLREVDRVEVLTLMDNYADVLLGNTKVVRRANHSGGGEIFRDTLVGEHGLSLLVTVREGGSGAHDPVRYRVQRLGRAA